MTTVVYPISCKEGMREMCRDLCNKIDLKCNFVYDKWDDILLIEVEEKSQ